MEVNVREKSTKNPIAAIVVGFVLFLVSFALLWWNEGNYVKNIKIADFTKKNVVSVTDKNSDNNGKLIHFTSNVKTQDNINDEFITRNDVMFSRFVEMYQWEEDKDSDGNVKYDKTWSDFHEITDKSHENPEFPYESNSYYAKNVDFGSFRLSSSLIHLLTPAFSMDTMADSHGYYGNGNYLYSRSDAYNNPQVGDVRISYQYLPSNSTVSVIAGQNGDVLEPYISNIGKIALVKNGKLSAAEMIADFEKTNTILTFILRFVGFLLMGTGLSMITNPISILFSFIGLGRFVENLTSFISFLIALILSLLTISIAWFVYRPVLSIVLLIITGLIAYFIFSRNKNNADKKL